MESSERKRRPASDEFENDEYPPTKPRRSDDGGENDTSEETDKDEEDNSSRASRPSEQINAPKVAEVGVVQKVYMENFMCHKKLTVDLCRNVNFIHGQNGSGKSAILVAIRICLGAGARRTHRARNLKELVRKEATGKNPISASAKIRVTVLNKGTDAYKHDIYGDSITVERCISIGGGYNGYKLLDHKKVKKSGSKKDLDEMLDHLNIKVDNPVTILDQEDAKSFLLGEPRHQYAFFLKATELERLDRMYASTLDRFLELEEFKKNCVPLLRT